MELKQNEKYTIFGISNFMAHTWRREVKVVEFDKETNKLCFKEGKKRKLHTTILNKDNALFEGWILPFVADSDTNNFQGNAMVNLVGNLEEIKNWFDNKQLNPSFEKYRLTWRGKEEEPKHTHLVYPELGEKEDMQ